MRLKKWDSKQNFKSYYNFEFLFYIPVIAQILNLISEILNLKIKKINLINDIKKHKKR